MSIAHFFLYRLRARWLIASIVIASSTLTLGLLRCSASETRPPTLGVIECQYVVVRPYLDRDPDTLTLGEAKSVMTELRRCHGLLTRHGLTEDIVRGDPFGIGAAPSTDGG